MKKITTIFAALLLLSCVNLLKAQDWNAAGNSLAGTGILGTTSNDDVAFWTNGNARGIITKTGLWGIGTTAPETYLHAQNGTFFANWPTYIWGSPGPTPAADDVTFLSTAGNGNTNNNYAVVGASQKHNSYLNVGVQGMGTNDHSNASPVNNASTYGVIGTAGGDVTVSGLFDNWGVLGAASGKDINNFGAVGWAITDYCDANNLTVGVQGFASGGVEIYGVVGAVDNPNNCTLATNNGQPAMFAGFFDGDLLVTGNDFLLSDEKLKTNIKALTDATDKLKQLDVKSYNFKRDEYKDLNLPGGIQMGIMAQNLESVFPDLVIDAKNPKIKKPTGGYMEEYYFKAVNYTGLIPVLVQSNQELSARLDEAEKVVEKVASLEQEIALLKKMMDGTSTDTRGSYLLQNVPNPANTGTRIGFTLAPDVSAGEVVLVNEMGNTIQRFVVKSGDQYLDVDIKNLVSGTYKYILIVNQKFADSKQMVVNH
jgi:hypothetical protein